MAEVQQVPFAFRSADQAHQAMDGALGAYLRAEMAAKGIVGFPVGAFDNGMRQIAGSKRPIVAPADLDGIRMRIPAGEMFDDTFRAFGAEPIVVNSNGIYDALKTGKVDAQENPLALIDLFRLYEVTKYVSMTNHMWSGFNLLANLPRGNACPSTSGRSIERNVTKYVRLQREDQEAANARLRAGWRSAGSRSTTSTRRPSARGSPACTRTGRRRSARSAGRCSRRQQDRWPERVTFGRLRASGSGSSGPICLQQPGEHTRRLCPTGPKKA